MLRNSVSKINLCVTVGILIGSYSYSRSRYVVAAELDRSLVPPEAKKGLLFIHQKYRDYRIKENKIPKDISALIQFLFAQSIKSGKDPQVAMNEINILKNPDNVMSENPLYGINTFSYHLLSQRPDGNMYSSPKLKSQRDVVAFTEIYVKRQLISNRRFLFGSYIVLWDDGDIEKIPFDYVIWYNTDGKVRQMSFKGQAGLPFSSFDEFDDDSQGIYADAVPLLKPPLVASVIDNGGPEGLVHLSRRENFPDIYGIDREELWKQFNPAQAEFTLADVQAGATKLGLNTQVQNLSLSQLQKSSSPAVLFLKDDGRIVALTALDEDRAIVIDRGLTRNVERSVLEVRYSGEALVPTKALTQNAGIVADDAVRSLQLKSLDEEVPQQFTLRNTGKMPLTLQLEYPLLGVTESKLSKDTLAPGETATLDLKVKWRSILKAPTQNVLVSLQTSDPIVPRLQLAILLNPPQTAVN